MYHFMSQGCLSRSQALKVIIRLMIWEPKSLMVDAAARLSQDCHDGKRVDSTGSLASFKRQRYTLRVQRLLAQNLLYLV